MVTDALVEFVAVDLMPLSVVDSDCFKTLLNTLDPMYQLPIRKHLSTKLLKKKYDHTKTQLLSQLRGTDNINLTLDLWSNKQMRSYLGITGHFISESWTFEAVMLGCNRVVGRHTAENVMLWYDEITSDLA